MATCGEFQILAPGNLPKIVMVFNLEFFLKPIGPIILSFSLKNTVKIYTKSILRA